MFLLGLNAVIPLPAADAAVAPTDPALHCSLAVLAAPAAALTAATAAAAGGFQALVSSGKGDLVLLTSNPGQQGKLLQAVCQHSLPPYPQRLPPLRLPPPPPRPPLLPSSCKGK